MEEFKAACQIRFPLSTVFRGSEEIVQLKRRVLEEVEDELELEDEKAETCI